MAKQKNPKKKNEKHAHKKGASMPKVKRQSNSFLNDKKLHCLLIFAFSIVLYANTYSHKYTQDDAIVIYDNMYTTAGVSGIPGILKYDTFYGFFKEAGKAGLVAGGRYRPFTLMMFAVEWEMFKQKKKDKDGNLVKDAKGNIEYEGNTVVFHFINVILYGITGVVLYLLLLRMLLHRKPGNEAYFIALAAALIFVAHPIHTEAVANIKGRDEILTLLGSLLGLHLAFKAYMEKKPMLVIAASICFFIALLSKENAITFLAIIPLSFWMFTKLDIGQSLLKTIPFLGVAIAFLVIRGFVLGDSQFGDAPREMMNNPYIKIVDNKYVDFSFGEWLATVFYTLGKYIQLLLFPHPLTHDYYPRHVEIMSFGNVKVILSVLAYFGLGFYGLWRTIKKDLIGYGILFFLITLSIVSNIFFPVGTNMSERFMFMPSIGFCFIAAVLLYRLTKKLANSETLSTANYSPALGVLALILIFFSAKTITRNFAWKDNLTLFTTDIKTSKRSAKLCNAVGGELVTQSVNIANPNERKAQLTEAITHLEQAIKIHPNYKNTYLLLGNANNYLENYQKSVDYYKKALTIDPNYKDAKNNIAITYRNGGKFFGDKGSDVVKAIQWLTEAYKLNPKDYETCRLLGVANGHSGQLQVALKYFKEAADIMPNHADALFNLGIAYRGIGDETNAQLNFQKAVKIDPEIVNKRGGQ